jgi:ABC-type Fe3+/spermidine/putrescine transport system ATPase subunit
MTTPAVRLDRVRVELAGSVAVDDLSLNVAGGECLAVLGPSGSGKTTLLRAIAGFVVPRSGAVALAGRIVSADGRSLVPTEQRNLAMVFQDLALWPHLTVRENLSFGLEAQRVPRSERDARVAGMLSTVGLSPKASCYPGELSGGERQRVAMARALVLEPIAVLFDEPLTNLDVALKDELLAALASWLDARTAAAIYVTHDPEEARALGNRIAILEQGRLVQVGSADDFAIAPHSSSSRRRAGRCDDRTPISS